jgi:hypothetical protein
MHALPVVWRIQFFIRQFPIADLAVLDGIQPVSNPYRTDFMDLRIHDKMDYGFTIWIYGSTDFTDFE